MIFFGRENFFQQDLLNRFLSQETGSNRQVDSVTEIIPKSADDVFGAILDLKISSFLSKKRFVVLKNCDKLIEKTEQELIDAVKNGLPYGFLILFLDKLSIKSKLGAAAKKKDCAINCRSLWDSPPPWLRHSSPYESELHQWTVMHAKELGLSLTPPLAGEIIGLTGNKPGAIDQELKKLRSRLDPGDKQPRPEHIKALVPDNRNDSVFSLVDSSLSGDLRTSHATLTRLFRLGYALPNELVLDRRTIGILTVGAFTSRLKTLRRCKSIIKESESIEALVSSGLIKRMQIPSISTQLRKLSTRNIEKAIQLTLKADRLLKGRSGPADPEVVVEQLVIGLSRL